MSWFFFPTLLQLPSFLFRVKSDIFKAHSSRWYTVKLGSTKLTHRWSFWIYSMSNILHRKKLLQFSLDLCRRVHWHPIRAFRFSHSLKVKFCELKEKRRGCEAADSHHVWAAVFLHQRDRPRLSPCASAAFRKGAQNSWFPDALLFP